MRSKFEAWIPKLGCDVDATKVAWRFDGNLMRSKFEAWIPKLGCEVDATKSRSRSGGLMRSKFEAWVPILDSGNWMRRSKRGGQLGIRCY